MHLARTTCAIVTIALPFSAQDRFATAVIDFVQGPGIGVFDTANVLGGPEGAGLGVGSLHVLTLGEGGSVTLGFDVTLTDGPGADLTVFENGFFAGGSNCFSEVCFVEVSTDGLEFARFPSHYSGPDSPAAPFGAIAAGTFAGMAGGHPVVANVLTGVGDPFDPVESGGESFDLAELSDHPSVGAGLVDLSSIHFVRLVDAIAGVDTDTSGNFVWDNGGTVNSCDVDAVAALNHTGSVTPTQPVADLEIDDAGFLHVRVGDPQGFFSLNLLTLRISFALSEFPSTLLFSNLFDFVSYDGNVLHMISSVPIPGTGLTSSFALSVEDLGGEAAGDQVMLQG